MSKILPIFITAPEFCALSRLAPASEATYARRQTNKLPPFTHAKGTKKRLYLVTDAAAWLDITAEDIYAAMGFEAAPAQNTQAVAEAFPFKETRGRKSNAERAHMAEMQKIAVMQTEAWGAK